MYMTFCYHQALKGYFYQCWKRIYISWMIIGNYTSYTKSEFYEIVNVIAKCLGQPLFAKCDFWNDLNNERYRQSKSNYHKRNNTFVQISFLVYSYILSWLILWRFLQIHFIYHQNTVTRKGAFFMNCFLIFLTHQHHLVELYSAMAKNALENFQVITCSLCAEYCRLPCSLRKFLWVKVESRLEWPNNF